MDLLISGSSGLIGSELCQHWENTHTLHRIRQKSKDGKRQWGSDLQLDQLPPIDAVVHLAGAGIADKRWSVARKQELIDSRVETTDQLVRELLALENRPSTVLCASAIGFYGSRGDELLSESSTPDDSFSSELCTAWEASTQPLRDAGIRVVNMRFGIVLSNKGGALAKMLPAFKFGGGGRMGSGTQWMSWISMPDVVRAIDFLLSTPTIDGPVNMTAPNAVQNQQFAQTLASSINRPCLLPMPAVMVKTLFGQMGEELLLGSAKVEPRLSDQ